MNGVVLVDCDDHGVRLPDSLRDASPRCLSFVGEHLLPERIDGLVLELLADLHPAEVLPDPRAHRLKAVPGRHGQDHGVAVDPGAVSGGGLFEEAFGQRRSGLPDSEAAFGPRTA